MWVDKSNVWETRNTNDEKLIAMIERRDQLAEKLDIKKGGVEPLMSMSSPSVKISYMDGVIVEHIVDLVNDCNTDTAIALLKRCDQEYRELILLCIDDIKVLRTLLAKSLT